MFFKLERQESETRSAFVNLFTSETSGPIFLLQFRLQTRIVIFHDIKCCFEHPCRTHSKINLCFLTVFLTFLVFNSLVKTIVTCLPATEETGAMGREIESHQGYTLVG
jgi:hypothetical protein